VRSNWWADLLEPLFVGLTEGLPIAVLYLLVEIVGGAPITLGSPIFVVAAALSALAAGRIARLGAAGWQVVALAALLVGTIGTLVGPGVVTALLAGDPGVAFGAQPGGWLLGLAAFRGMVGAGALEDPDRAGRPFVRGVIGLTLIWLYAGLLPTANQDAFRAAALGPTLLLGTVGIAVVGLRRVHAIAVPTGIEWWRNRAWLAALVILVLALAAVAVPAGNWLTTAVPGILSLAGFPEVVVFGLFVAWLVVPRRGPRRPRTSTLRGILGLTGVLLIGAIVYRLLHSNTEQGAAAAGIARPTVSTTSNGLFGVLIVVVVLIGIAVLAVLLARNRRGPSSLPEAGQVNDDAAFEVEGPGWSWLRRARNRWFGPRAAGRPADAQAAYLATLSLLEALAGRRRLPLETPRAHARRIRREGDGTIELDLLAADYELSRWGARQLAARETRRAIGRWERSKVWIAARIQAEEAAAQHAEDSAGTGPG